MTTENAVLFPPTELIVAIQFWPGDEARAMRLARLIADIEPRRRDDVTIAFCRRFDMDVQSALGWETTAHVSKKFRTMTLRSEREGVGHPRGCNELWAGTLEELSRSWWAGRIGAHSVFTVESDGCPLRRDWLDMLIAEHERSIFAGKLVTGCLTRHGAPHFNGTLIAHLALWLDRPSLRRTPPDQAWDMFHAPTLLAAGRDTPLIKNVYGAKSWAPDVLEAMSKETAWLSSTKSEAAIEWAERALVGKK